MFPTRSTQQARETQKEKRFVPTRNAMQKTSPLNAARPKHKRPRCKKRSKAEQKTQFRFRQNAVNRHVSGLASLRKHHSDRLEGHLTLFHVPSEWLRLTYIDFYRVIYSTLSIPCQAPKIKKPPSRATYIKSSKRGLPDRAEASAQLRRI